MNRQLMTFLGLELPFDPRVLYSDAGTGGDNGAGGGSGAGSGGTPEPSSTPPAATPPAGPNWTEFLGSIENLNNSLGGRLDTVVETVRTASQTPAAAEEPPDYESMSRVELVGHIMSGVADTIQAQLSEALRPFVEQLNGLQSNVVTRSVSQEIETLRTAHRDFNDWKTEMVEISKVHPTLTVKQIYNLARSEFPDKAKTLDAKFADPAPRPIFRPRGFGGLPPGAPGSTSTDSKPISAADAGREAYREVAQRHPGVLAALENM